MEIPIILSGFLFLCIFVESMQIPMNLKEKAEGIHGAKGTATIAVVLFVVYFVAFQTVLSHVVFYQEEHHLFLFSPEYIQYVWHWEGWSALVANFLIQFFYYPILGSCILSSLLVSLYLIFHWGITSLMKEKDLLQLAVLPSLAAFFFLSSIENTLSTIIEWVCFSFLAALICHVVSRFLPSVRKGFKISPFITFGFLAVYAIGGYLYFWKSYPYNERRLYLVSHLARQGDWERVVHFTEGYFQTGRTNNMMTYYHNMGLYFMGKLPKHLFQYNKELGAQSLYLPWKGSKDDCEFGALLYEKLGQLSIAHRWEFEAMVMYGETAPHLLNLIRYNIADGRPKVALRFINTLKRSLFYAKLANAYEAQLQNRQVEGLHNSFENKKADERSFFDPTTLTVNLEEILKADPTNKMAYEYLMCELLLSNELETFAMYYPLAKQHYSEVPQVFQETMNYIYQKGGTAHE